MQYADVILPLATPPMTFAVEEPLREQIRCGMQVIVQMGARKFYAGIVCRLHREHPPYKTIKPILQLSGQECAVTPEQLRLWEWIAAYYLAPIGMVMRAALPAKLKLDGFSCEETLAGAYRLPTENCIRLSQAISDQEALLRTLDTLTRARGRSRALLEYLAQTGWDPQQPPCERPQIAARTDANAQAACAPTQQKETPAFDFREPPLLPKRRLNATTGVIKALIEHGIFEAIERPYAPSTSATTASTPLPQLSPAQQAALNDLRSGLEKRDVALLYGVTGSGKTELYIHLMAEQLAAGANVLYMLPEIALTAQLIERMRHYFGERVVVYHSRLSDARRAGVYRTLLASTGGELIIGVRSSVLLPLPKLGLIIVDEEHENSFKQADSSPRYQARDTAIVLGSYYRAPVVLGSATPSLESYYNALCGKYALVRLSERYSGVQMPEVLLSDTLRAARRGEKRSHFNKLLLERMDAALTAGKQVMLFQNRRGFSPYIECGGCGWSASCPNCNVTLTYHKSDGTLRCHYCGYQTTLPPRCPACGTEELQPRGFGTEKIEEALCEIFPEVPIARLDADTSRTAQSYQRIVSAFERGETRILIGTQMITKGFDFGEVALVGILNADNLLNYPDFRAGERAFQLMMQVGGRAGRRDTQGCVVIQTSQPTHPILAQLIQSDYEAMARSQLAERQAFLYPPYCRLITITLRHRDKALLWQAAGVLSDKLRVLFGRRLLGPEAPPVDRVRGQFLARLLLKIEKQRSVTEAKQLLSIQFEALHAQPAFRGVEILPDVDPQ